MRLDVFKRETPTEFAPEQLELVEEEEEGLGPDVDEGVEQVRLPSSTFALMRTRIHALLFPLSSTASRV